MFRILQWSDSHHENEAVSATNALIRSVPSLDLPIHCGDIVENRYPQDYGMFDPLLTTCVMGNHDTTDSHGAIVDAYKYYDQPSQETLYNIYFAKMRDTFSLDMEQNTTWWSKEFTDKGVLFIGLNDTVFGNNLDAELEYVSTKVAYAESKSLSIAVAKHGPSNTFVPVKCNFTSPYMNNSTEFTTDKNDYLNFYRNGGDKLLELILGSKCKVLYILAGHEHADGFGLVTRYNSQKVPYIHIGSSLKDKWNDVARGGASVTSNAVCNMIDYVPELDSLRVYRLGADASNGGIARKMLTFSYSDNAIVSSCGVRK